MEPQKSFSSQEIIPNTQVPLRSKLVSRSWVATYFFILGLLAYIAVLFYQTPIDTLLGPFVYLMSGGTSTVPLLTLSTSAIIYLSIFLAGIFGVYCVARYILSRSKTQQTTGIAWYERIILSPLAVGALTFLNTLFWVSYSIKRTDPQDLGGFAILAYQGTLAFYPLVSILFSFIVFFFIRSRNRFRWAFIIVVVVTLLRPALGAAWAAYQQYQTDRHNAQDQRRSAVATSFLDCTKIDTIDNWEECAKKTIHTDADYHACLNFARNQSDYVSLYADTCNRVSGKSDIANTNTMQDCTQALASASWSKCLKKHLLTEDDFTTCKSIARSDGQLQLCYQQFAQISKDPTVCDGLTEESNIHQNCESAFMNSLTAAEAPIDCVKFATQAKVVGCLLLQLNPNKKNSVEDIHKVCAVIPPNATISSYNQSSYEVNCLSDTAQYSDPQFCLSKPNSQDQLYCLEQQLYAQRGNPDARKIVCSAIPQGYPFYGLISSCQ